MPNDKPDNKNVERPSLETSNEQTSKVSLTGGDAHPSLSSGDPSPALASGPILETDSSDKINTTMAAGRVPKPGLESSEDKLASKISDKAPTKPKGGKPIPTGKNWYDLIQMILKLLLEDGLIQGLIHGATTGVAAGAINLAGHPLNEAFKEAMENKDNGFSAMLQGIAKGLITGGAKAPEEALKTIAAHYAQGLLQHSEYHEFLSADFKKLADREDFISSVAEQTAQAADALKPPMLKPPTLKPQTLTLLNYILKKGKSLMELAKTNQEPPKPQPEESTLQQRTAHHQKTPPTKPEKP